MKSEILKFLKKLASSYQRNLKYGYRVNPQKLAFAEYILSWHEAYCKTTTEEGTLRLCVKYRSKIEALLPGSNHKMYASLSNEFEQIFKYINQRNGIEYTTKQTLFDEQVTDDDHKIYRQLSLAQAFADAQR